MTREAGVRQSFKLPTVQLHRLRTVLPAKSRAEEDVLRCLDRCNRVRSIQPWSEIQLSQGLEINDTPVTRGSNYVRWAVEDVRGRKFAVACLTRQAFRHSEISWQALDAQIAQKGYELRLILTGDLPRSMVLQAEAFMIHINTEMEPQLHAKCLSILNQQRVAPLNAVVAELVEWSGRPASEIYPSLYGMLARNELSANPSISPPMCPVGFPGAPGCLTPLILGRRPENILLDTNSESQDHRNEQPKVLPPQVRQFLRSERGQAYRQLFSRLANHALPLTRDEATILGNVCQLSVSTVYRFRKTFIEAGGSGITFETLAPYLVTHRSIVSNDRLQPEVRQIIHDTIHEGYLVRPGERVRISTVSELTQVIGRRCVKKNLPAPCRRTISRALEGLKSRDPLRFAKLRYGVNAQDKLRPRQGSFETTSAGALLALDCTPCDIIMNSSGKGFYVQPRQKTKTAPSRRAWMIVVKDIASGVILNLSIVERKPKARDIISTLQSVFLHTAKHFQDAGVQHRPAGHGLPQRLRLDGGSEFVNKAVRQVMETLGIELLPRKAWNRHYGGSEERAIKVLTFAQHALEGTTLNRFYLKEPFEKNFISSLTLPDLTRFSLLVMQAYNMKAAPLSPVSRLEMEYRLHESGLSAWRPLAHEQRQYIEQGMLPVVTACCQREGIYLHNLCYRSEEIDNLIVAKRTVDIRYDPNDIRNIWLLHPDEEKTFRLTARLPHWIDDSKPIALDFWVNLYKHINNSQSRLKAKVPTHYEMALDLERNIAINKNTPIARESHVVDQDAPFLAWDSEEDFYMVSRGSE